MVPLEYSQAFRLAPKFKQDTLITIIASSHECKNPQSQLVLELCQLRLSPISLRFIAREAERYSV
jgi:hypothetical protein